MKPTDDAKFLEILAGVHDFYGKELSTFAGKVWLEAVQSFGLEQVSKAFSAHLMDPERGAFMPKPSDIVRQLQGTHADRSLIAWGKALQAASSVGAYATVCFDDPVIHVVLEDIGGWPKFCQTKTDELPFVQRRFCDSYRAYSGRGETISYPPTLTGIHDRENAPGGYKSARPVLIGDTEKAKLVLQNGSLDRIGAMSLGSALQIASGRKA